MFSGWPCMAVVLAAGIAGEHEQHLANLRRKDLLPQLRNDSSICCLGRLFCLELCGFCSWCGEHRESGFAHAACTVRGDWSYAPYRAAYTAL
jgi:hypothetical protein